MISKTILLGNVGSEPETRNLESGNKVTTFSLITSEIYKNNQGEMITDTELHNIVCCGNLTEIAEKYVKKGDLLYIEGSKETRSYEDKNGIKKYVVDIVAKELNITPKKTGPKTNEAPPQNELDESDNLPF